MEQRNIKMTKKAKKEFMDGLYKFISDANTNRANRCIRCGFRAFNYLKYLIGYDKDLKVCFSGFYFEQDDNVSSNYIWFDYQSNTEYAIQLLEKGEKSFASQGSNVILWYGE